MTILKVNKLSKHLSEGSSSRTLFSDVSLTIEQPELVSIIGRSGSGKSTLLHCLVGLDQADSGEIIYSSGKLDPNNPAACARLRLNDLGIVFQFFNFLPTLTVQENILIPGLLAGSARTELQQRVEYLTDLLGISETLKRYPDSVSGGELQRAAIARALINRPSIIFADEPTGNLDEENALRVLELFKLLVEKEKVAVLVVTHDDSLKQISGRAFELISENLQLCS